MNGIHVHVHIVPLDEGPDTKPSPPVDGPLGHVANVFDFGQNIEEVEKRLLRQETFFKAESLQFRARLAGEKLFYKGIVDVSILVRVWRVAEHLQPGAASHQILEDTTRVDFPTQLQGVKTGGRRGGRLHDGLLQGEAVAGGGDVVHEQFEYLQRHTVGLDGCQGIEGNTDHFVEAQSGQVTANIPGNILQFDPVLLI